MDTSVIIAALMSPTGGARLLFHLGEAGAIRLFVGKSVLREADEVLRRKAPELLPILAQLLNEAHVEIGEDPSEENIRKAGQLVKYLPDARVLAEALQVQADWFITHDREHFLNNPALADLPFRIGTPGDVIVWLRERL
ncbi:PIN domain-containing protein [bacterium]|nr:PIN domain-containing protein [bacterium]